MAYVYEHWRPDLHLPFWVGKGSGNRARLLAAKKQWQNPAFRELVSSTMKATNAKRRRPCTEQY